MIGYLTQGIYIFKWCIPFGILLFAVIEALLFLTKKDNFAILAKEICSVSDVNYYFPSIFVRFCGSQELSDRNILFIFQTFPLEIYWRFRLWGLL